MNSVQPRPGVTLSSGEKFEFAGLEVVNRTAAAVTVAFDALQKELTCEYGQRRAFADVYSNKLVIADDAQKGGIIFLA